MVSTEACGDQSTRKHREAKVTLERPKQLFEGRGKDSSAEEPRVRTPGVWLARVP